MTVDIFTSYEVYCDSCNGGTQPLGRYDRTEVGIISNKQMAIKYWQNQGWIFGNGSFCPDCYKRMEGELSR